MVMSRTRSHMQNTSYRWNLQMDWERALLNGRCDVHPQSQVRHDGITHSNITNCQQSGEPLRKDRKYIRIAQQEF